MAQPRVLLLGGHGKIAMLMTPIMLLRSWHVTSIIRNPDHREEVMKLGREYPGKLDVLVDSVEKHQEAKDAKALLEKTRPDYVIWAAGAGGKGGAERTYAVDRDAAKAFIEAGATSSNIKKFLLISYIASRRNRAPWWNDEDWAAAQKVNNETLPDYHKAKVDADEYFVAWAEKRRKSGDTSFQAINLRPGTLTDDAATGKVSMGHTRSSGKVTRADVADVVVRLLERDDVRGYIDLLNGEQDVKSEIERIAVEKVDSLQGEDLDRIYSLVQ